MRAVIQRVSSASVIIDGGTRRTTGLGLVVLVGIAIGDGDGDVEWMARKLCSLRLFDDGTGRMNLSVQDIGGGLMIVSQFTLLATTKKGTRPGFELAATPEVGRTCYQKLVDMLAQRLPDRVVTGEFGAHMEVSINNIGPVTIVLDSKKRE